MLYKRTITPPKPPSKLDNLSGLGKLRRAPKAFKIPLSSFKLVAGFPSPAEEHVEKRLDPSEFLIDQEEATFYAEIEGESMIEAGLLPGDYVVVNKAKRAKSGDIVVAIIDGEFTIKTLIKSRGSKPRLLPANRLYPEIEIKEGMQFEIWGVVTGSFRRFK